MRRLSFSLAIRLGISLICCFLPSVPAAAAPTAAELRAQIERHGFPYWKNATEAMVKLRAEMRDEFYVQRWTELDSGLKAMPRREFVERLMQAVEPKEVNADML
jgi:hypothetical protein